MLSLIKWFKIIFYMFFYYISEKDTKIAVKRFSKKVIDICKAQVIVNKDIDKELKNCVIMATHKSYFDIFCIEYCFEHSKIIWFAKKELFKIPIFGYMLKKTNALSIDRNSVIKSALIIRKLLKERKENVVFAIFPYGTRKHTHNFKNGGIYFAKKLKLPIIPVRIEGSENVMPPKSITIREQQVVNIKVFNEISPHTSFEEIETLIKSSI